MADNAGDNVYGERNDSVRSHPSSPDSHNPNDGSPDHGTPEESQSAQKQPKVTWEDDETRCFIQIYKRLCPNLEDSSYTLTRLLHDLASELQLMGYRRKFSSVRYRWKSLRAAYKRLSASRCAHPERKLPYFKEVSEIFGRKSLSNGSAVQHSKVPLAVEHMKTEPSSSDKSQNTNKKLVKRLRLSKDYSEYKTVDDFVIRTSNTLKKKVKNGHIPPKKVTAATSKKDTVKNTPLQLWSSMMYQCGQCRKKFKSSQEMHAHHCEGKTQKNSAKLENGGKNPVPAKVENVPFEISLKPTGDAPIVKNKKWSVPTVKTIGEVMGFLRQYMKLDKTASLFLYVNQAFAPSPDDLIGNVHQCFNVNGTLVLHYSTSPAWG